MTENLTICFEHPDFVVINKPAGISVHKDEQAVGLSEKLAKQLGVEKLWLVHRLDKVTSGLLIFARNQTAAVNFYHLFHEHKVEKTYLALSDKKPKKKQGKNLCPTKNPPAITQFHSLSLAPNLRLFILQPKTGKTHQLRVAMKSLSSPILGDMRYAGSTADRVYLHAYQLAFVYQGEDFLIRAWPTSGHFWANIDESAIMAISQPK